MTKKITLYTKNNCVQCNMVKKFLVSKGLDKITHYINLDENPEDVEYLKEIGIMSVPYLISYGPNNIEKDFINGFRPDLLNKLSA